MARRRSIQRLPCDDLRSCSTLHASGAKCSPATASCRWSRDIYAGANWEYDHDMFLIMCCLNFYSYSYIYIYMYKSNIYIYIIIYIHMIQKNEKRFRFRFL